jgi:hypothetical protein
VLFAWGRIHAGSTESSDAWSTEPAFENQFFLEMHAATRVGDDPHQRDNTKRAARQGVKIRDVNGVSQVGKGERLTRSTKIIGQEESVGECLGIVAVDLQR